MVIATGLANDASCHILDPLQLIMQFIRNTIQKTISVIKLAQGSESRVQSHVASNNP